MYLTIGSYQLIETMAQHTVDDDSMHKTPYAKLNLLMDILEQSYCPTTVDQVLLSDPGFLVKAEMSVMGGKLRLRTRENTIDIYDMSEIPTHASGKLFGYPDCCIEWFTTGRVMNYLKCIPPELEHTGFIPCPKCIERDPKELLEFIANRRITPIPFPDGEASDELELIAWLKYIRQPLGDNLKIVEARYPDFDFSKLLTN